MEIEVVNREIIKPSSPTPNHLKKFSFSIFDQSMTDIYIPLVFFYLPGDGIKVIDQIQKLKESLSEALVWFYPVAGRVIKDELYVDCNDQGVDFIESKVNDLRLSDVLRHPEEAVVVKFLPHSTVQSGADYLLGVQVNVFECGGVALGVFFRHLIMDLCAMSAFLKGWVAAACGDMEMPALDLDVVASRFPAISMSVPVFDFIQVCNCRTSRFVFSGAKIAALRDKAAATSTERPTRVVSVTALIWMCLLNMSTKKSREGTRRSIFSHAMNLRKRVDPPLSENSLGNMTKLVLIESGNYNEFTDKLQGLVGELKLSLRDAIENFVKRSKDSEQVMTTIGEDSKKWGMLARDDIDFYACTSWCKFGLYEADFGWGRPAWISTVNFSFNNCVVMMDSRDGGGIEVWVTLEEEDMTLFETDQELLEFASLNPSLCP